MKIENITQAKAFLSLRGSLFWPDLKKWIEEQIASKHTTACNSEDRECRLLQGGAMTLAEFISKVECSRETMDRFENSIK